MSAPLPALAYALPTRDSGVQANPTPVWNGCQRILAALVLACCLPLLAACAIAIKLTSRGPVLFVQWRRGLNGKLFRVFKLRTIALGAESSTAHGVGRGHSSITSVGKVLREFKFDELPQLWNVVRGDMLIVGPRPIPVALDDRLRDEISGFETRYRCTPGLTHLSQVVLHDNGTGDQLLEDWRRRWKAERHYLARRSPAYDVVVVCLTVAFLMRRVASAVLRRAHAPSTQRVERSDERNVLGIPVSALNYDGVLQRIGEWVHAKRRCYVGVTPVHSLMDAVFSASHRANLRGAALNTADGVPVTWALRALGARGATRVYGPDLMLRALAKAEQAGWRVAFYGGHEDRLPVLLERLQERFPRLNVVAAISPPFRPLTPEEDEAHVAQLNAAQPDLVWVGLGAPKQEAWMASHETRVPGVKLGVGAAFDFHAGAVRQAPPVLQRLGLEWAFRLACEPRRLLWRYVRSNPLYVALVALQVARHWTRKASA